MTERMTLKISGNRLPDLPRSDEPKTLKFEKPDWKSFRSVDTLCQKAGVHKGLLRRLVLKELVDNALDAGAEVDIAEPIPGTYVIKDDGPGIDGTPEKIAQLFSINRPMISSKLLRLPQRGALGNGLRVVAGVAVAASDGKLIVTTRNQRIKIMPQDDGTATAETEIVDHPVGTTVEITFGPEVPLDPYEPRVWAWNAISIAAAPSYTGRSSPHWYDADAFFELINAAVDTPVREIIATLDGCTGAKAGVIADGFQGRACNSLTRAETTALLERAQQHARPVNPDRLGSIGFLAGYKGYGIKKGTVETGSRMPMAAMPFVIEAWAKPGKQNFSIFVNRTPIADETQSWFEKRTVFLSGGNHDAEFKAAEALAVVINITTPHCPITSDGKSPDLEPFETEIDAAIKQAIKTAKRHQPRSEKVTQKSVVLDNLDDAIDQASGERQFRFSPRQVFYVPVFLASALSHLSHGTRIHES